MDLWKKAIPENVYFNYKSTRNFKIIKFIYKNQKL